MFDAVYGGVFSRSALGTVEFLCQAFVQDGVHQRGFAGTGNAGDAVESPQFERCREVFEVVFGCAVHGQPMAVAVAPRGRHRNALAAAQVLAGERVLAVQKPVHRTGIQDVAAVDAGARADVYHPVGRAYGIFIVLHDDEGVADIPQMAQGVQQSRVVPLVQADTGLVQHVQHPHEIRADLRG